MKVFVAGGTGVVGRRAVAQLVQSGHEISVIARSEEKAALVASLGATPVRCSLFDADALRSSLVGHDAVVNLATHIPPVTAAARGSAWAENDRVRIEGSHHLVDAALAAGVGRYVQESIAFLYADGGDEWLDEDHPLADPPVAPSVAIEAVEREAARFTAAGGTGVVLRFGIFHAADSGHTAATLQLTRWGISPVPGPASAYLPIVHADDAATAVVAALDAPAGTYNVVDDEPLTRAGYAQAWERALGDPGRVRTVPAAVARPMLSKAPNMAWSHRVSNRRLREATGWAPRYRSGREALAQVVASSREPRRLRSPLAALGLVVLAIGSLLVGGWALGAPGSFHDSFPGFGRAWVAADGPFNEHLLRDVGALNLALAVVTLVALGSMALTLVRATAVAHLVYGVPHLLYHATHLGHVESVDQVGIVVSLAVPVLVAAGLLVLSRGRRRAGATVTATPAGGHPGPAVAPATSAAPHAV